MTMERNLTHDERIDVAYRVFRAMCAQYRDPLIALVDAQGCTLARSDWWDSPTNVIECPKCGARVMRRASRTPHIDACGFESYDFECRECGAPLARIVDPYDKTLLLSG